MITTIKKPGDQMLVRTTGGYIIRGVEDHGALLSTSDADIFVSLSTLRTLLAEVERSTRRTVQP